MNRISLRRTRGRRATTALWTALGVAAAVAIATTAGTLGYWLGNSQLPQLNISTPRLAQLESMFERERKTLEVADRESQAQLDAFVGRVGEMQAEILRLNALGERLVEMAELDPEEFDFENPPPQGGADDILADRKTSLAEFTGDMTDLRSLISDRKRKLQQLEQAIMEMDLKKHATPSGWPVRSGYITSKFGYRIDPIRKRSQFHSGVDFAGKPGSVVVATADGIVIHSGWRAGYGRLVEVRHMDGLVTRYAHNQENLVKQGEMIKKGQVIAKLGSSGRSTGPHVHFEVRKNGSAINPLKFVGTKPGQPSG